MIEYPGLKELPDPYLAVRVQVVRFVSAEPQPGVVEFELVDMNGKTWVFRDKIGIALVEDVSSDSAFPTPGRVACGVLGLLSDDDGRPAVWIDTNVYWGVWSVDDVMQFDVLLSQLVVVDRATGRESPAKWPAGAPDQQ